MPAPPPQLPGVVGLSAAPPFFLRMVRRAADWGDPAAPALQRAADVAKSVFDIDDPQHSLFRVETDADLLRVVVGLCARRDYPTRGPFFFVPFTPDDLIAADITAELVREDMTGCYTANRQLHHDAPADADKLRKLCRIAFEAGRQLHEYRKPVLKVIHAETGKYGCPALPTPANCKDVACVTLPVPVVAGG